MQKKNLENFGGIKYFLRVFQMCAELYDKIFIPQIDYSMMEKLGLQDCYLSMEYKYKVYTQSKI